MQLPQLSTTLDTLKQNLESALKLRGIAQPNLIGIRSGGVWIAEYLRKSLQVEAPIGVLDISFHRDDFSRMGLNPNVKPSHMPWDLDGEHIVLVDDVLFTGRTIRAAMNEIFDWGRPASITLAVLIARNGRELPIYADAVGCELELESGQHIKLRGPDPLRLELVETSTSND